MNAPVFFSRPTSRATSASVTAVLLLSTTSPSQVLAVSESLATQALSLSQLDASLETFTANTLGVNSGAQVQDGVTFHELEPLPPGVPLSKARTREEARKASEEAKHERAVRKP